MWTWGMGVFNSVKPIHTSSLSKQFSTEVDQLMYFIHFDVSKTRGKDRGTLKKQMHLKKVGIAVAHSEQEKNIHTLIYFFEHDSSYQTYRMHNHQVQSWTTKKQQGSHLSWILFCRQHSSVFIQSLLWMKPYSSSPYHLICHEKKQKKREKESCMTEYDFFLPYSYTQQKRTEKKETLEGGCLDEFI